MFRSFMIICVLSLVGAGAQAALVSRSGGQAYYDTDTNLTWVAGANLAKTSGYAAYGYMDWDQSVGWAASLNAQNAGLGYLGVNNWRLPTVTDTGTAGCNFAYTGTDCGYNVDLATGEMARMYYSTLGNTGAFNTSGVRTCVGGGPNGCLTNTGPFSNLLAGFYWYGKEDAPGTGGAWDFVFGSGEQGTYNEAEGFFAWAVRTGDIGTQAAVPIPPAVWLFGSAVGLMGVVRRKITS